MKADGLLAENTKVRSSKYLNNLIEHDHRHIKSRTKVMVGFKRFRSAATTISGIELAQHIRKGRFDLSKLGLRGVAVPTVWNAVMSDRQGILSIENLSAGSHICTKTCGNATFFHAVRRCSFWLLCAVRVPCGYWNTVISTRRFLILP